MLNRRYRYILMNSWIDECLLPDALHENGKICFGLLAIDLPLNLLFREIMYATAACRSSLSALNTRKLLGVSFIRWFKFGRRGRTILALRRLSYAYIILLSSSSRLSCAIHDDRLQYDIEFVHLTFLRRFFYRCICLFFRGVLSATQMMPVTRTF